MPTAQELIATLALQPLPREGGYYRETYRSAAAWPTRPGKALSTAIYYLLTADSFSALHRLPTDELFHFYLGDPVLMLQLLPDGGGREVLLGTDLAGGQRPQILVPAGVWQGSVLLPGGRCALLGTTMAPGFDFSDYESGQRDELVASYRSHAERIRQLTRDLV